MQTALVAVCLLFVGALIFRDFLFGNAILLYKDIGNDSLLDYYPTFAHLSDYVRTVGWPSWSFCIGMGQDLAYAAGYLIWEPVTWLPKGWIAQALVFQHLAKIVIAGLLFLFFLERLRIPFLAAFLGSLLLSFSAYMNMGSCWFPFADEVIVFAAVLLGVEIALQGGGYLLLTIAVALVGIINPFFLYLCALLLLFYVPARLGSQRGWAPKLILQKSIPLALFALVGVGIGAAITLPYLNVTLNSPRGAGATDNAFLRSVPIFATENAAHYVTAILRTYGNDLVGTANAFKGWHNYLEAPLPYCGLFCLVIFPQAFFGRSWWTRLILLLFLAFVLIPTIFPWFRYLFWLFKGDYYRTFSLFGVLGIIITSAITFGRYMRSGALNVAALVITTASLIALLYLPNAGLQAVIDARLRTFITGYLILYTVVLLAGRATKKLVPASSVVLALAAIELIQFGSTTVANRDVVQKQDLIKGIAARAELVEMLQDVRRDDHSVFRISTLRLSEQGNETDPNDPMLLGYYGTTAYTSFNDLNYIRFLAAAEVTPARLETETRWVGGLTGNLILSMFGGEKYVLAEDPALFQRAAQYEAVRAYGKYYLFRNRLALPLGLTYSRYLPEKEFFRLSRDGKEQALLAVAVVDQNERPKTTACSPISLSELDAELTASTFPALVERRQATALSLTSFRHNKLQGTIHLEQDSLLVLQTAFGRGWRAFEDGQPVSVLRIDMGLLGVPVKAGEHSIELRYRNPWQIAGMIITIISSLLLAVALWRRPRLAIAPSN